MRVHYCMGLSLWLLIIELIGVNCQFDDDFLSFFSSDTSTSSSSSSKSPELEARLKSFKVVSRIRFRYARTTVEAEVRNPSRQAARPTSFTLLLPDHAFISNLTMLIRGKEYVAEVKEKEEASAIFEDALAAGKDAAVAHRDTPQHLRDTNQITVQVNVSPRGRFRVRLTYEELLTRRLGVYHHLIHVSPGRLVDDLSVDVGLEESSELITPLRVLRRDPKLGLSNESLVNLYYLIRYENSERPRRAVVRMTASKEDQRFVDDVRGISEQVVIEYDVHREDSMRGEMHLSSTNGFFVHFFAPKLVEPLRRHLMLLIDISGSMLKEDKLTDTQNALVAIMDELEEKDVFDLIAFGDKLHSFKTENNSNVIKASKTNKAAALDFGLKLNTLEGGNVNLALEKALEIVEVNKKDALENVQSVIILITDGDLKYPGQEEESVIESVSKRNEMLKVPIFVLAMAKELGFVKELAERNFGKAMLVEHADDTVVQLEELFREVSRPQLMDVALDYSGIDANSLSSVRGADVFNEGSEIVVAGKIDKEEGAVTVDIRSRGSALTSGRSEQVYFCDFDLQQRKENTVELVELQRLNASTTEATQSQVSNNGSNSLDCVAVNVHSAMETADSGEVDFLERLWAFQRIQTLLEADQVSEKRREEAVQLALKYNFVTEVTSLIIVKPEENHQGLLNTRDSKLVKLTLPVLKAKSSALKANVFTSKLTAASGGLEKPSLPLPPPPPPSRDPPLDLPHHSPPLPPPAPPRPTTTTSPPRRPRPTQTTRRPRPTQTTRRPTFVTFTTTEDSVKYFVTEEEDDDDLFDGLGGADHGGSIDYNFNPPSDFEKALAGVGDDDEEEDNDFQDGLFDDGDRFEPDEDSDMEEEEDDDDDDLFFGEEEDAFDNDGIPNFGGCQGVVFIYNSTFLRGDVRFFVDDVFSLEEYEFDKALTSMEIRGDCCWHFFTKPFFEGEPVAIFGKGIYESFKDLGPAFRTVSSILNDGFC